MNLRIDRCGDTAKVSTYRNTRSATATSRLNCVFRAENHESAVTLPFGIPQIPETVAAHKPALKSPASPQKNHSKRHSPPDRSTPSDSPAGPPTENKSSADIPPSPPPSLTTWLLPARNAGSPAFAHKLSKLHIESTASSGVVTNPARIFANWKTSSQVFGAAPPAAFSRSGRYPATCDAASIASAY